MVSSVYVVVTPFVEVSQIIIVLLHACKTKRVMGETL